MTRLRNVRVGDKFVLSTEPGVYKKVTHNKARCVFGPRELFNTEREIDPEAQVFVIPREVEKPVRTPRAVKAEDVSSPEPDAKPEPEPVLPVAEPSIAGEYKVVLVNENDEVVHEMDVSREEFSVCASISFIRVRFPGKRKDSAFSVTESGYSFVEKKLYLEVHEE